MTNQTEITKTNIENIKIKKKMIETISRRKEHEDIPIIGTSDWFIHV